MEARNEYDYEIVNARIRPIARRLVEKYEELRHIDVDNILFVVNHKTGVGKKKIVLARTRRIPDKWRDLMFQLGDSGCSHIVEFIGKATSCLDENQMIALAYRELLMIGPEGEIVTPDTNDWWHIIKALGRHWLYTDSTCPNILDDCNDLKKLIDGGFEPTRA